VAVTVEPAIEPDAPARSPTHTSAKDGELTPRCRKDVVVLTSTVSVVVLFHVVRVKVPALPATPQVPVVLDPFTAVTVPKTPCSRGRLRTGAMNTVLAVTVPLETVPRAPAISPTHTSTKEGELTPGSAKVVDVLTSTVY
jgi:hypothetical protein